jgi:hypothetical protein
MHGELMEFNSHLQTILRKKDLAIRRLREELVDLRGPLAAPLLNEDNTTSGFDDESWDIVDSGNSYDGGGRGSPSRRHIHLTHNERVLINIWIPSAFLTGANTDLHHVYQASQYSIMSTFHFPQTNSRSKGFAIKVMMLETH